MSRGHRSMDCTHWYPSDNTVYPDVVAAWYRECYAVSYAILARHHRMYRNRNSTCKNKYQSRDKWIIRRLPGCEGEILSLVKVAMTTTAENCLYLAENSTVASHRKRCTMHEVFILSTCWTARDHCVTLFFPFRG